MLRGERKAKLEGSCEEETSYPGARGANGVRQEREQSRAGLRAPTTRGQAQSGN